MEDVQDTIRELRTCEQLAQVTQDPHFREMYLTEAQVIRLRLEIELREPVLA